MGIAEHGSGNNRPINDKFCSLTFQYPKGRRRKSPRRNIGPKLWVSIARNDARDTLLRQVGSLTGKWHIFSMMAQSEDII